MSHELQEVLGITNLYTLDTTIKIAMEDKDPPGGLIIAVDGPEECRNVLRLHRDYVSTFLKSLNRQLGDNLTNLPVTAYYSRHKVYGMGIRGIQKRGQ